MDSVDTMGSLGPRNTFAFNLDNEFDEFIGVSGLDLNSMIASLQKASGSNPRRTVHRNMSVT